jgi:hypothetical protein
MFLVQTLRVYAALPAMCPTPNPIPNYFQCMSNAWFHPCNCTVIYFLKLYAYKQCEVC